MKVMPTSFHVVRCLHRAIDDRPTERGRQAEQASKKAPTPDVERHLGAHRAAGPERVIDDADVAVTRSMREIASLVRSRTRRRALVVVLGAAEPVVLDPRGSARARFRADSKRAPAPRPPGG